MGKCSALGVQMWTASIVGIGQEVSVIAGCALDRKLVREAPGLFRVRAAMPATSTLPEPAHTFRVNPAHEAGAENCGLHFFHDTFSSNRSIMYEISKIVR